MNERAIKTGAVNRLISNGLCRTLRRNCELYYSTQTDRRAHPYSGFVVTDMMHTFDPVSFNAFARLLAQPDPTDLPRRANVRRCEGDPNRRATCLPAIHVVWLRRCQLETDVEEPPASATPLLNAADIGHAPVLRALRSGARSPVA